MLPHELQALMAKILFFIFSFLVLTMARVKADVPPPHSLFASQTNQITLEHKKN